MPGPSAHTQRNKAHKAGRHAISARRKSKLGKEVGEARQSIKAVHSSSKAERLMAAKQQRSAKQKELLDKKRRGGVPLVAAVLPLSSDVDAERLWGLLTSFEGSTGKKNDMDTEMMVVEGATGTVTRALDQSGRQRITLIPPPKQPQDLLGVVELGRCAEVLLLVLAGGSKSVAIDKHGEDTLAVLRALGLPAVAVLVQDTSEGAAGAGAGSASMKERAARKKHAEKALSTQLAGEHRIFHADTHEDWSTLQRHLQQLPPQPPLWRCQRPSLMAQEADWVADSAQHTEADAAENGVATGTLVLTGYIRYLALSAGQAVTIPGVGDYPVQKIEGLRDPLLATLSHKRGDAHMEEEEEARLLAAATEEECAPIVREAPVDTLAGEQTWPTEEEMMEAEARSGVKKKRRKVPKGTSEYQAAWILDDYSDEEEDEDEEEEDDMDDAPKLVGPSGMADPEPQHDGQSWEETIDGSAVDTDMDGMDEDVDDETAVKLREEYKAMKEKRLAEQEEQEFPDEVETPLDTPARTRFQKYRGLKSFRTSPWDPKESLPPEYERVYGFDNFKRAQKRALDAAKKADTQNPSSVPAGSYVRVHICGVPEAQGRTVTARVTASQNDSVTPLTVFGLLEHETKLSVCHYALHKSSSYTDSIANKEELLFVTGLRTFSTRPVMSGDEHGADKYKMSRFLHAGQHSIASVYAPISYQPLPLLAFKLQDGRVPRLAATGALRGCSPDRVVLKKIVLVGYPVRVHKSKAVVRFMFHNPDDIRWFRPCELWTKYGRRGRILEPVGTHGAMKCLFDGPVQQRDSICMSLYKRVYPKWPQDMTFA